jgi:RNA polymerase-binding transcription factor DksA
MTKEDISKELAKALWQKSILDKRDMQRIILKKLTEIFDKKYNRCDVCGVPIEEGSICSDKCGDKWLVMYLP